MPQKELSSIISDEIHIWTYEHDDMEKLSTAKDCLSVAEIARAERFITIQLRDTFIRNRVFLRELLSRYLQSKPSEVSFDYGAHGKPELSRTETERGVRFNFAHSGSIAVCAIASNQDVGIDVEKERAMNDIDAIADRFFAVQEADRFHKLPAEEKQRYFFKCWTAKEAFIKASGEGLSRRLDSFVVPFLENDPNCISVAYDDVWEPSAWKLHRFQVKEGYPAALVALELNPERVIIQTWNEPAL